ncbi:MAG: NADH dehydrogenase subunit M [Candidatus Entotheonella factor]|uniref:NADH dehydrogenase subunit M n=1 Tax=Entotheonella factor TaxID=1429438 RepID=W4LKW1_ENTF1|nr:proton-conducting transporter membrane subunit [Candidatus Entotheonella palauensis]ETW97986.1 MAG: NADH dehydrogenase subunit M [Candidatus Entotheonella factor]
MNWDAWLPLSVVLSSLVPGILIAMLREESHRLRTVYNLIGATAKFVLVGTMLWGVSQGYVYETRLSLIPGIDFVLHADALPLLFVTLSTVLWLLTTIYAIGYLEDAPHRSRFFVFFSLCVSATVGLALAGNLLTFVIFYEMLTLATYPLVVHRGTEAALRAGRTYLTYTLGGGALLLLAVAWLYALGGSLEFIEGGALNGADALPRGALTAIFVMLITGLGVKAALVPLHGWLPLAMVAPAPVSALLHAVAVVKAGAFGMVRVVYDVFGIELSADLGLTGPLVVLASITIVYGSVRALSQDELKRRLAFSTVSQVSYIALGIALGSPLATIGGIVHLVHQGLMKITLFFCAGNLAETLGVHHVSEMRGAARRMPWTMAAFTLGALGMIGVPPLAGFISKWYLGIGAFEAEQPWVIGVLVVSSLLNAAYFLPIVYLAWFQSPPDTWPDEHPSGRFETSLTLLAPPVITAALAVVVGLLADMPFSPLAWVKLITFREYGL